MWVAFMGVEGVGKELVMVYGFVLTLLLFACGCG